MSSFKNLYIIIFKKINNKLCTKPLAKKLNNPLQNYKKNRLLKESSIKGALVALKPEPKKEHAVISKTKCVVHNIHLGKTNKPKMVFKKNVQFKFVSFLDNPFMWLKGLYNNVYIGDDDRLGSRHRVMPTYCSLPNGMNKHKYNDLHKYTKVLNSKNDASIFTTKKSFSPSKLLEPYTDSPSVKNINIVTKDLSCSTLDERSILATCLCVLPLAQNKIINEDITEQTNDSLKTIDNLDTRLEENLLFPDCFQSLKTYPNDFNHLLTSKIQDDVALTVLHVNVEDLKNQMKKGDKMQLTAPLDTQCAGESPKSKKSDSKIMVPKKTNSDNSIEHIIMNYKVNSFSLGECDFSSNNSGDHKKPKKPTKKDKPVSNNNESKTDTTTTTMKPVVKPQVPIKNIRPPQQEQINVKSQPQQQQQQIQQQQFDASANQQQNYWQMSPNIPPEQMYYYWPMDYIMPIQMYQPNKQETASKGNLPETTPGSKEKSSDVIVGQPWKNTPFVSKNSQKIKQDKDNFDQMQAYNYNSGWPVHYMDTYNLPPVSHQQPQNQLEQQQHYVQMINASTNAAKAMSATQAQPKVSVEAQPKVSVEAQPKVSVDLPDVSKPSSNETNPKKKTTKEKITATLVQLLHINSDKKSSTQKTAQSTTFSQLHAPDALVPNKEKIILGQSSKIPPTAISDQSSKIPLTAPQPQPQDIAQAYNSPYTYGQTFGQEQQNFQQTDPQVQYAEVYQAQPTSEQTNWYMAQSPEQMVFTYEPLDQQSFEPNVPSEQVHSPVFSQEAFEQKILSQLRNTFEEKELPQQPVHLQQNTSEEKVLPQQKTFESKIPPQSLYERQNTFVQKVLPLQISKQDIAQHIFERKVLPQPFSYQSYTQENPSVKKVFAQQDSSAVKSAQPTLEQKALPQQSFYQPIVYPQESPEQPVFVQAFEQTQQVVPSVNNESVYAAQSANPASWSEYYTQVPDNQAHYKSYDEVFTMASRENLKNYQKHTLHKNSLKQPKTSEKHAEKSETKNPLQEIIGKHKTDEQIIKKKDQTKKADSVAKIEYKPWEQQSHQILNTPVTINSETNQESSKKNRLNTKSSETSAANTIKKETPVMTIAPTATKTMGSQQKICEISVKEVSKDQQKQPSVEWGQTTSTSWGEEPQPQNTSKGTSTEWTPNSFNNKTTWTDLSQPQTQPQSQNTKEGETKPSDQQNFSAAATHWQNGWNTQQFNESGQQQSATPQEYSQMYYTNSQQQNYYPQTNPWKQTSTYQYHTLNEAIAQKKITSIQSEYELKQNYKLLDSYSMLDTKSDLYRIKDVKSKLPLVPISHNASKATSVPKYKVRSTDKNEKHYLYCNYNSVPTLDNLEMFLTIPLKDNCIEDMFKEDKKIVIDTNSPPPEPFVFEVSDKNKTAKSLIKDEEIKSDDMALLSKIDAFVNAKPKSCMDKSDSLYLFNHLKDFPSSAKRKLHIQHVENVEFEEMCKHSSLLLSCRIVVDGSERNEPSTTLHAKVYGYNEHRHHVIISTNDKKK